MGRGNSDCVFVFRLLSPQIRVKLRHPFRHHQNIKYKNRIIIVNITTIIVPMSPYIKSQNLYSTTVLFLTGLLLYYVSYAYASYLINHFSFKYKV